MAFNQFFPCIPDYMSWEDWNGNFIMYYGQENVPYHTEENWRVTAKNIAEMVTFSSYPVADPDLYPDWQTWAKNLTEIINGLSH